MDVLPHPFPIICFAGLLAALVMVLYRVIRGPHVLDRIMCVEAVTLISVCLMGVWQVTVGSRYFFDAVLVLSIVGFIGTVLLSRYLESGGLFRD
ncbi:MAG: cation:proton antiporter [Candidatus Sumerlaeia bacterium]|nr:cation:proton antiporter [Candidatus Sumerlaeia bacterium]